MLKTLHVISAIAPRYGGTSTAIVAMVQALNALPDIKAEIATTDANGPRRLQAHELEIKSKVHLFPRTWSEQWKMSIRLGRWLRAHAGDYDLVDIHGIWSYSTSTAARAAELHGIPYTVRPAGMLSPYTWSRGRLKKGLYWRLFERRTIHGAQGFHVTSEEEGDEVRALRPDARTFVIPNGVETAAFSEKRDESSLRRKCGQSADGVPILLFLSRLHPKKGIVDRLLPAVAAMRTRSFLAIVGDEDTRAPGYVNEIKRAIQRLSLEGRVSLLGPIMGEQRWAMFDGAAAFVLPSHAENFGIVVAEAMARACPVVVTKEVQSGALVNQAGAGEVVDGGALQFAAALDALVSDDTERLAAGGRGRDFARHHLQWSSVAERLKSMYLDIVSATANG